MKIRILSVLFIIVALSCKSRKENQTEIKNIESGTFDIVSIEGKKVTGSKITMNIDLDENRVSGNTGCNTYGADFIENERSIKMGYSRVTKRFCKGRMELEHKFLRNLKEVQTYSYDGQNLQLQTYDGETLIKAKKVENE